MWTSLKISPTKSIDFSSDLPSQHASRKECIDVGENAVHGHSETDNKLLASDEGCINSNLVNELDNQ